VQVATLRFVQPPEEVAVIPAALRRVSAWLWVSFAAVVTVARSVTRTTENCGGC
jgi:hypothetical protein